MEYLSFDEKDPNADFPKAIKTAFEKYNSSNYKEAIVDLNKAIKLQPKYAPAYNLRGLCKSGLKDFKNSISDYDKAIKLKPDYAAAYMNRGDSNAYLKRNKKAFEDYLEVTKIDSKNDTAFDYCGLQKTVLGNFEESIKYFDKAININPNNADYYLSRGFSKLKLNNKQSAYLDLKKAKELGSKDAAQAIKKYLPQYLKENTPHLKALEKLIKEQEPLLKILKENKDKRRPKPTKISKKNQEEYSKKHDMWEERGRDKNLKADIISSEIYPKKVYLDEKVFVFTTLKFKNALYNRKTEVFGKFPTIEGFKKIGGLITRGGQSREYDGEGGVITETYARQIYRPTRIGTFKTPEFSIKINNDIVEVGSHTIEVIDKVEEVEEVLNAWYFKKSFIWFCRILFVLIFTALIWWIWTI